jgi:subtilase family serine protease
MPAWACAIAAGSARQCLRAVVTLTGVMMAVGAISPGISLAQTFTPATLGQAYGLNLLGANYTGAGQTIALIEVGGSLGTGGESNLYSDVKGFDSKYSLPALNPGSNLNVMNQSGGTGSNLPAYDSSWAEETTLDVEYAHAIAPGAKIEVVEATLGSNDDQTISNIYAAASYAASRRGGKASVVSLSLTITPEDSNADQYFTAGNSPGVVFVASTGDSGSSSGLGTPSSLPDVIAVGGTSLKVNASGTYAGETAWSGSGGGVSDYEPRPSYQANVPQDASSPGYRTVPDVAFDADPDTGVSIVYDGSSVNYVGGTSVGAPSWAGLFALADQHLAAAGKPLLSSVSALEAMYATYGTSAYSNAFHDIVGGSNGAYTATAGYDEVTGLGSPIANDLVPYLGGQMSLLQVAAIPEPGGVAVVLVVGMVMGMGRRRSRKIRSCVAFRAEDGPALSRLGYRIAR